MLAQQILAMQEELEEVIVPSERTTFSKKKAQGQNRQWPKIVPPPPKKKKNFFGDFSQMWVGGVADSHPRSKTLKKKQITPKIAFFDPKFTFRSPKSHKNPGVGGC